MFSYYVDGYYVQVHPLAQDGCSLTLPRGSDGVEVLRAAVNQDCIESFRTVRERGHEMLDCINDVCAGATNSPGIVPDTRWGVDWTGEKSSQYRSDYQRSGLQGYAASKGDLFIARLYFVN